MARGSCRARIAAMVFTASNQCSESSACVRELNFFQAVRSGSFKVKPQPRTGIFQFLPTFLLACHLAAERDGNFDHMHTGFPQQSQCQTADDVVIIRMRRKNQHDRSINGRSRLVMRRNVARRQRFRFFNKLGKRSSKVIIGIRCHADANKHRACLSFQLFHRKSSRDTPLFRGVLGRLYSMVY